MPIFGFSRQFVRASRESARYARGTQDCGRVGHASELDGPDRVNPQTDEIENYFLTGCYR